MVVRAQGALSQFGGFLTGDENYGPTPATAGLDLNKRFTIEPGLATPPEMDAGGAGVRSLLTRGPHPTVWFLIAATVVLALLLHEKAFLRGSFGIGG